MYRVIPRCSFNTRNLTISPIIISLNNAYISQLFGPQIHSLSNFLSRSFTIFNMKLFIAVALLCAVAAVSATLPNQKWPPRSTGPTFPRPNNPRYRFRREDDPHRSIRVQGNIPVGNSRQQPSVDVNYEHRLSDTGRRTVDAYSGLNLQSGRVQPHAGVRFEHNFDNGFFLKGYGQGQTGRGGRVEPQFGAGFGLRFRREIEAEETDAEFEEQ